MRLVNLRWATAGLALAIAACSAPAPTATAPTQVLIPAPPTSTAVTATPSETPPPILAPGDIVNPEATPIAEDLQPIVQQIIDDLASSIDVDTESIQVVRLESAFWMTDELGCGAQSTQASERGEGYQIILFANNTFYEYHTAGSERYLRCETIDPTAAATLAVGILLEVDPVAAELVLLAQQRVAAELDLPLRRIRAVDVRQIRWTDSSLGCPQPDQSYTQVITEGYRIVVSAGDQEYIFHSDFDRLLLCDPEREQLPED
ncbi:MAG: hypothetical protein U0694_27020 [Anaerolineae bacterium]